MRIPKPVKTLFKYVPILAVVAAMGIGLFMGRDLKQLPLESRSVTAMPVLTRSSEPQPPVIQGQASSCDFGLFYTSLPPKCKTAHGSFIQAGEGSPFVMKIPGVK